MLTAYAGTGASVVTVNGQVFFRSLNTGKYCRIAVKGIIPAGVRGLLQQQQCGTAFQLICDVELPGQASRFTYTGKGLTFNNFPLVNQGPGKPMHLSCNRGGGSGDTIAFTPAPSTCPSGSETGPGPGINPASVRPGATTPVTTSYTVLQTGTGGASATLASPRDQCRLVLTTTGLTISRTATGATAFTTGTFPATTGPRRLRLTPSGSLVLEDASGNALWASPGMCGAPNPLSGCYSTQMQDSCNLVVRSKDGLVVWDSALAPAWNSPSKQQLVSGTSRQLSCLEASRTAATSLSSSNRAYRLATTWPAAATDLVNTASKVVHWRAQGLPGGSGAASFCLETDGSLRTTNTSMTLWRSTYAAPGVARGRYTARVTSTGSLHVYDGTCRLIYSSPVAPIPSPPSPRPPPKRIIPAKTPCAPGKHAPPPMMRTSPPPPKPCAPVKHSSPPPKKGVIAAGTPVPKAARPPPPQRKAPRMPPGARIRVISGPMMSSASSYVTEEKVTAPFVKITAGRVVMPTRASPSPPITLRRVHPPPPKQRAAATAAAEAAAATVIKEEVIKEVPQPSGPSGNSTNSSMAAPPRKAARKAGSRKAKCSTLMPASSPCGGLAVCGKDAPCQLPVGCCDEGLRCRRRNPFLWVCKAAAPPPGPR